MTPPGILVANGNNSVVNATVLVSISSPLLCILSLYALEESLDNQNIWKKVFLALLESYAFFFP